MDLSLKLSRFAKSLLLSAVLLGWAEVSAAAPAGGFLPQSRLGYTVGDQWEPAVAADDYGHVFVLYPQYGTVPGCTSCRVPSMVLLVSNDSGASWERPRLIAPTPSGQFDPQIAVDPADRRTLYAAWLQNGRRDVVLAKSGDFGQTWSVVASDRVRSDVDKPVLAVRGPNVYLGFNHHQKLWVMASHDGGSTFTVADINTNPNLGWAQASGATVDPAGNVYIGWTGYSQNRAADGQVGLYVSRSADGGQSWTASQIGSSGAPPACAAFKCSWAYLGAQIVLASDAAGTLYALWNASAADRGAARTFFATSSNAGASWTVRQGVSEAALGVQHAFPAIVAGAAGDVRVAWMDTRRSGLWNTYYRTSADGGKSWSAEAQVSSFVAGYNYITREGFKFPFGDYFLMAIDGRGVTHAVWGEGQNFQSPGSIWYSSGR
jgi:hypothetical protein